MTKRMIILFAPILYDIFVSIVYRIGWGGGCKGYSPACTYIMMFSIYCAGGLGMGGGLNIMGGGMSPQGFVDMFLGVVRPVYKYESE